MQITLTNTGKRFNREWVFRHIDLEFNPGSSYAITGPNGSGKSTLLQVIAGAIQHNEGAVTFTDTKNQQPVSGVDVYQHISIATPYLELIEEMTATELLQFHTTFKNLTNPIPEILTAMHLDNAANKQIRYFSSGMKQRLKLAQAIFCNSRVLLLDEPTTNLDADGIALYHQLIKKYKKEKLLIVSSNDKQEYSFCEEVISISDYK